nr:hypothetical protein [Coralloluteibacterium stylophorae]
MADAIDEMSHETKGLAAILNVARQFLKDNNIEATAAPGSHMANLANKVAEFPFDPERDAPLN